ncbi:MAG TPA: hypothetical protein VLF18_01445 [Tahibacter sp.]|uniref:glycan biosynthesis hexose transferase WsfD n=1 Tax=Tahibacter sp. TaxID=2056211 RepID=UPI002B9CEE3C|nr:hypothetical protein [Tahibacter sp.]HSX58839.1 hypothetical protein [Tahibacter sp.]
MTAKPRLALILIVLAFALGLLRAVPLLTHAPLLAIANSFDQARYTGCFDLFPDRPAAIRPDENSPNAPFEFYRFQKNPVRLCYGSSELLPQAVAVGVYKIQESQGVERHSVRWIGGLRLFVLSLLVALFCRAWWKRGLWPAALANAVVFAAVLTDPSDTMYFNTFYAEATALVAAYALFNLILLHAHSPRTRGGIALLALAALALATSKIQHLVLPLCLAAGVLAFGRWHLGRWPWQGWALLAGAVIGCGIQVTQLARGDTMMNSIRSFNRANLVFTGLLPAVSDPLATTQRLGLPAACAAHVGKSAWQLPGLAEDVCPGMEKLGRTDVVIEFLREPVALLRFFGNGIAVLNPWLPRNLGHVEGEILGKLPPQFVSWNGLLDRQPVLRNLLFALPLLMAVVALRRRDRFALFALLAAMLPPATFGITIFGDGLADVAKQGHLIFNTTLAFACTAIVLGVCALVARRSLSAPLALDRMNAVQFDQQFGAANVAEQDESLRRVG